MFNELSCLRDFVRSNFPILVTPSTFSLYFLSDTMYNFFENVFGIISRFYHVLHFVKVVSFQWYNWKFHFWIFRYWRGSKNWFMVVFTLYPWIFLFENIKYVYTGCLKAYTWYFLRRYLAVLIFLCAKEALLDVFKCFFFIFLL